MLCVAISVSGTGLSELVTVRAPGHQAYKTKIVLDPATGLELE